MVALSWRPFGEEVWNLDPYIHGHFTISAWWLSIMILSSGSMGILTA